MSQPRDRIEDILIAVAIPCWNEATTIAKVVQDFRRVLPSATIYVFDNNSTDSSPELARQAGAVIRGVHDRGKGFVVRAIFESVKVDILIIVDGDDTYSAEDSRRLALPILRGEADMVVGNRLERAREDALHPVRHIGNKVIGVAVNAMLGTSYRDTLSGFRAFSRRFVESVQLHAQGFEIETELSARALEERMTVSEVPISYRSRPPGSQSKLQSLRDGFRILTTSLALSWDYRPARFYCLVGLVFLFLFAFLVLARFLTAR
jgi:glycosyltransferase involved in cell wall biosynthesis